MCGWREVAVAASAVSATTPVPSEFVPKVDRAGHGPHCAAAARLLLPPGGSDSGSSSSRLSRIQCPSQPVPLLVPLGRPLLIEVLQYPELGTGFKPRTCQ